MRNCTIEQGLLENISALLLIRSHTHRPVVLKPLRAAPKLVLGKQGRLRYRLLEAKRVLVEFHFGRDEGLGSLRKAGRVGMLLQQRLLVSGLTLKIEPLVVVFELDFAALEAELVVEEVHRTVGEDLAHTPRVDRAAEVEVEPLLG